MIDVKGWLADTYNPAETTVSNLLGEHWPIGTEQGGVLTVSREFGGGLPFLVDQPLNGPAMGFYPSQLRVVYNDWFRRVENLQNKHARMRLAQLVNPWTRASSTDGLVDLTYSNEGILPLYNQFNDALRTVGSRFQKGLENSLFLEIHQAN
jgi:hypothetical protein